MEILLIILGLLLFINVFSMYLIANLSIEKPHNNIFRLLRKYLKL